MATRIGIDVGGTFTDMIFWDEESGSVYVAKTPTTPDAIEEGVLEAVRSTIPAGLLQAAEFLLHGTTVGLNALLQGRGARTGLVCTEGFRDTLEIRRGDRTLPYDLLWKPPIPLVPRRHRLPVRERVRADGVVVGELVASDVYAAAEVLKRDGVEAIAVCFLNAYANPVHELRTEELLRDAGFDGDISLSHRLSREYREYERTSTTVIDAYTRGVTSRYLERLESKLSEQGFDGDLLVTRSGGGAMLAKTVAERPFEAIQSGPVAGAEGAAEICRRRGWELGIAADVGGTSFDTSLIVGGRTQVKREGAIVGWPIQGAWVDVHSIGAGGGSIAFTDHGLLSVGPRSAGADPGPACYGRGGEDPTVTDAALLLGMFGDGTLSPSLQLKSELAERALAPVADELGISVEDAARGVMRIVSASMAGAMREITIGQGEDPREARLILFGGAGPLFATLLANELEVPETVVPPYAGNFSAWGLLSQDFIQEGARTLIRRLDDAALPELNYNLRDLFEELGARHGVDDDDSFDRIAGFDLRYLGQEHTLTVELEARGDISAGDLTLITNQFERDYNKRFGTTLGEPLDLVSIRATLRKSLPRGTVEHVVGNEAAGIKRAAGVRAYSFMNEEWLDFAVYERSKLRSLQVLAGPAIIFEATATTYVDAGHTFVIDNSGYLVIREDQ